jgi:flagellar biogenesis protein FliO
MTIIEGVDVSQNSRMNIIEGTDASQNVRIDYSNTALTIAQGVDNSQNVRIDYSNTAITIIQGVDVTQNTRLTVIEGTDASQNVRLDYSNAAITIIQGVDVGQNSRMTIIEGVDNSQNVRLDFSNARMTIIEGVDVTQNTNISNRLALSGVASQTVSGNVVFGNDVTVTGNLIVLGNTISLNVSSLEVDDSLIQLAIGNYYTDTLSIGYVGHYNDGTNAHAGFIRDSGTKEFYAFQGYTPETTGNVINVNAASFAKANIHGNWFKGNLIATTARVNGLDISTVVTASYNQANTGTVLAQAAYNQANVTIGVDTTQNTRLTVIEGTDLSQNVRLDFSNTRMTIIEGVDASQNVRLDFSNTRMAIIEGTDLSQNVRLDYSNTAITIIQGVNVGQNTAIAATDGKMQAAYNLANTADVKAQAAFDKANTGGASGLDQYARDTANSASANTIIIQGVDVTQNARLTIIESTNVSQNARMTIIEGVDVGQNTRMTVIENTDLSQNVSINTQNSFITIIQNVDVGQNNRMTIIENTDLSQNVRLDFSNTRIALNESVDASQNVRLDFSNTRIALNESVDASQNVRLDFSNTRIALNESVDASQNVRLDYSNTAINATDNKMQSAYNQANTGGGGGLAFSRVIVSGSPDAIANIANAPLTFVAGSGMTITTVGTSNTITFSSTGGFSGGTITNQLIIANSNNAISNSTGALQITGGGGVGVTGNLYVGGTNAGVNGVYTDVLRYAANGLPWVMGGGGGGGGAILSSVAAATTYYIGLSAASSGSWTDARVDTSNLFYTTANGTLFVTNYNTSSDYNLKDNIITITDGLNTIEKLRGVSFTWKNSGEKSYGVIAQELEQILPDIVSGAGGHKSVNYNALIGFLIEAVKELSDRVDELEKK